ncbi:MAG: methyltransferase family protein [Candidatus Hermodarchaeota archaeon]
MVYKINLILVYTVTPVFFLLSLYLAFKIRHEYRNYQKRSLCTSVLCLLYHDLFVVLACYSAWYNTWPFFNLYIYFYSHLAFFIFGTIIIFFSSVIFVLYLTTIKSVVRATGLNSDKLIIEGIFSISRNPGSLGRSIGLIGLGLMGRSFFTLLLAILWISINHFNVLTEEKYLKDKFGESYQHYCNLTPRYLSFKKNNNII